MDGKKSSSCSLESSEIVNADASPTTSPIKEEELRARSTAAGPLTYVTDVSQPELLSVASSSQPNAEEEVTDEVIQRDDDLDGLINESSSCSLSSGVTDEKRTPCGGHLEYSEIVSAVAYPTTSIKEEELRARYIAAGPHEVKQRDDDLDGLINDLSYLLELMETSKTARELEAARDEWVSIRNLPDPGSGRKSKLDAWSGMKDAWSGMKESVRDFPDFVKDMFSSNCTITCLLLVGFLHKTSKSAFSFRMKPMSFRMKCISMLQEILEYMSIFQEITMVTREIHTETSKYLKSHALTRVAVDLADSFSRMIDHTILSRNGRSFSKSIDKDLRDLRERLFNELTALHKEITLQLITKMTTDMERKFAEYAVGIRSPAAEVIAQDSGIETKTDTIVEENPAESRALRKSKNEQEMERFNISANENQEIHPCISAYEILEDEFREPLHDIYSFFDGWDWSTVANIVGNSELETLQTKALVIKKANTVKVHDAILSKCLQDTDGTVVTNASQIRRLLKKEQDIQKITGIWLLHENKGFPSMTAAKLDLMCQSLRVLALGKFGKVEGKCREVFHKMVFFQAGIPQFPFDVGTINKLRYFSFKHEDSQLQKGYSNGYVRLNSKLQYPRALKMESPWGLSFEMTKTGNALKRMKLYHRERKCRCFDGLRYKGSLLNLVTLWDLKYPGVPHDRYGFFAALKDALFGLKKSRSLEDLPHHLGNLICLSREINLLKHHEHSIYLESIARLMSILCSLEISSCSESHDSQDLLFQIPFLQSLARCSSLDKLLYGFGELKNLTVLNLQNCWLLKKLPQGLGELKCLVELDLSFCCSLEDFCTDFHSLQSLQILKLISCESLKKLPQDFHLLVSLQRLDLSFCCSLEDLCTNFHLLPSLQILNLTSCESLKKLPQDFHLLVSLQLLSLKFCKKLEGESMDKVTKCKKLERLFIGGSPMLEKRWEAMKKKGKQSSSLVVYTKEEGTSDKDNRASQL